MNGSSVMPDDRVHFLDPFAWIEEPRWTAWKAEQRKGRSTKVPYCAPGSRSRANDPKTWLSRDGAKSVARRHGMSGVGVFLGPLSAGQALFGVDLDSCLDLEGKLASWAQPVLDLFSTYAEVSPSGTGLKLFGLLANADHDAALLLLDKQATRTWNLPSARSHPPGAALSLERRYFTVTRQRFQGSPSEIRICSLQSIRNLVEHVGPALTIMTDPEFPPTAQARNVSRDMIRAMKQDSITSGGAPYRLQALAQSRPRLRALLNGDFSHLRDQSRSGRDLSFVSFCAKAGLSREETCAALLTWPHGRGPENDARQFERMWRKATKSFEPNQDDRAVAKIEPGRLDQAVTHALREMANAGLGIYQRGGALVRPVRVPVRVSNNRAVEVLRIQVLDTHTFLDQVATVVCFERFDLKAKAWRSTNCPEQIARAALTRAGSWPFPTLSGVIVAPTLRPDGTLLEKPGYDPTSGLLFDPQGVAFPKISISPTRADAIASLARLNTLFETFPFVAPEDQSAAIAALLTAIARPGIDHAPLFAITAPAAGSGKSLLVDVISTLVSGNPAPVIAQGRSEEEFEKRLDSALLAGAQLLSIDNCENAVGGEKLCQLLTQKRLSARPLGRSELVDISPIAIVFATGNNLTLKGDVTRRAILIALDAGEERPELRTFNSNPIAAASANRGAFIADGLTILRAYLAAGRPSRPIPLGSFEAWSDLVRGALLWLGLPDPVLTMDRLRERDPEREALICALTGWLQAFGEQEQTAADAIEVSKRDPALRMALSEILGGDQAVDARRLGKWLSRHSGRIEGGWKFVVRKGHRGASFWRLSRGGGGGFGASRSTNPREDDDGTNSQKESPTESHASKTATPSNLDDEE